MGVGVEGFDTEGLVNEVRWGGSAWAGNDGDDAAAATAALCGAGDSRKSCDLPISGAER